MISISTLSYDPAGNVIFKESPNSEMGNLTARVSRISTLDGGNVLINSGVIEGDRTIKIEASVTEKTALTIKEIYSKSPIVNIACLSGFFYGALQSVKIDNGELQITFLVIRKMNE